MIALLANLFLNGCVAYTTYLVIVAITDSMVIGAAAATVSVGVTIVCSERVARWYSRTRYPR